MTATVAVGTHPTGMHSCCKSFKIGFTYGNTVFVAARYSTSFVQGFWKLNSLDLIRTNEPSFAFIRYGFDSTFSLFRKAVLMKKIYLWLLLLTKFY